MTAEELAAIAVIPDAVFDDTSIPIWENLRPLLAEAIGTKVDQAGIFGTDKPASWPLALAPGAVAAGNVMTETAPDFGVSVAELAQKIVTGSGYNVSGFITQPGFRWRLRALRSPGDGQFVYDPNANTLYGLPADEVMNGAWGVTDPGTTLIEVDWSKVFIGIRQDITVKILDQSVISDDTGKVIINLAQQDAKAMRVVFRVGFQVYTPANRVGNAATKYPAGVLTAAPISG
jgi:HK97 family phage major capsid protein